MIIITMLPLSTMQSASVFSFIKKRMYSSIKFFKLITKNFLFHFPGENSLHENIGPGNQSNGR